FVYFFFQAEDGIRDATVTGVQTCALPISTQQPTIARMNFRGSRQARTQKDARAQSSAERSTANPEIPPARNSVRTPRSRTNLLASVRRGLLGFAGLAPHSGRSSVPFRLTLFRDRR